MSRHAQETRRAVADRDRGHARLRTVTATAGVMSVVTAGAVAFALPGAHHTASASSASAASGSAAASTRTSGSSGTSAGSSTGSSGLSKASTAPSASSGSGTVTSGGS